MRAVQRQCGFAPGDVRAIMVESQPIFGRTLAWRIVDAADGVIEAGEVEVDAIADAHPWPAG
jgi:hypothetical protein